MKRIVIALAVALGALAAVPLIAGAGAAPSAQSSALSISITPNPVTCCNAVVIRGKLTGPKVAGQRVTLEHDIAPFGGGFSAVTNTTTDGNGNYQFTRVPTKNVAYRVRHKREFSAAKVAVVRPKVTVGVSDRTPDRGERVRFRGNVRPEHDGLRVRIQRRNRRGGWNTLAHALLRDTGEARSRYRRRVRINRSGRYRVRFPGDGDHAAGNSRRIRLNVEG